MKIGFFPDPYRDELLYSACARYAQRVKYVNKRFVAEEIFGEKGFSAIVDFPTHLLALSKTLPLNNYSIEEFINENTLLPFFGPFLPKTRALVVRQEMTKADTSNVSARLGIRVKQILPPKYLRFCPLCVENDRSRYGETYWHRMHQLAGIIICSEHQSFLENSLLLWGRESNMSFQAAEEFVLPIKPRLIDSNNKTHQILLKLTRDAEWLLSQNNLCLDTKVLQKRYFNLLLKEGFAYYNGRIKHTKFIKACDDYFSPELFEMIGRVSKQEDWLSILLQSEKSNVVYHPVRHLLLMTFLRLTAEEFFTSFVEFKPFGNPPYPCLNKTANHYREMRILKCEIFDNLSKDKKNKGHPIAYFSCDCGFIYQRIGPDKSEADKFTYSLVREYGQTWERRFAELWAKLAVYNSEIGKQVGISITSVGRQAIRLNLPMNTETTRFLQGYNRHRNPKKTLSQMRADYRRKWIEILRNNPTLTRQELMNTANFLYLWCRRYDLNWFEKNLPAVDKIKRTGRILDWKKIDKELSTQIKRVCDQIFSIKSFPVRVSITEIIRRIGNKKWIEKREQKLPLTTRILNEKLESLEDYMVRKVEWAKEEVIKEKILPTKLQFKVKAVVRNKTSEKSDKVQKAITLALKTLKIEFNL